ncbi:MAG: beta-lactamase family protein [Clostridia bacterium]|nr:beta-lactamase family protein [Clostridia bacterium]
MITYTTPEKVGVSTENIKKLIDKLEQKGFCAHSMIMARGNEIFFEKYWAPFDKDFKHRMYSVTKSFVSLAVGFLEQDGKINLDDKMIKYFPDELKEQKDENIKNQTIRHMLMMSTAKPERNWFYHKPDDRVRFYFENPLEESRPSGTIWNYDSAGSFILGAMVERVTGKTLVEYLNEKLFNKLGIEGAYMLKCPGGHSWGDSALIMKTMDLFKSARFVLNGGSWNGEQLLNEEYVKTATSNLINNSPFGLNEVNDLGYGYQFWRTCHNSFYFNGMGCQYAVCSPDKDLIFVINSDTMDAKFLKGEVLDYYFDLIYETAKDVPLEEYKGEPIGDKELYSLKNEINSPIQDKINGKKFVCNENPMGITEFSFNFGNDGKCEFNYVNEQGAKTLYFGMGRNEFGIFPQEGYSDEVGTVFAKGNYYKCASSAKWTHENQLQIKVQIIDKYFGNASFIFGFTEDLTAGVRMFGAGEDFLGEYNGYATGKILK